MKNNMYHIISDSYRIRTVNRRVYSPLHTIVCDASTYTYIQMLFGLFVLQSLSFNSECNSDTNEIVATEEDENYHNCICECLWTWFTAHYSGIKKEPHKMPSFSPRRFARCRRAVVICIQPTTKLFIDFTTNQTHHLQDVQKVDEREHTHTETTFNDLTVPLFCCFCWTESVLICSNMF